MKISSMIKGKMDKTDRITPDKQNKTKIPIKCQICQNLILSEIIVLS